MHQTNRSKRIPWQAVSKRKDTKLSLDWKVGRLETNSRRGTGGSYKWMKGPDVTKLKVKVKIFCE